VTHRKFEIGDDVILVDGRHIPSHLVWFPEMNACVGNVVTIKTIHSLYDTQYINIKASFEDVIGTYSWDIKWLSHFNDCNIYDDLETILYEREV
jgi:hypothetical protein